LVVASDPHALIFTREPRAGVEPDVLTRYRLSVIGCIYPAELMLGYVLLSDQLLMSTVALAALRAVPSNFT
jgi:hypothetical protein